MQDTYYTVGKIVNTHGLRGELKILPTTDFPDERFQKGSELLIEHPQLAERLPVTVASAKPHKNTYLLKLKQYDHIQDVEKFKGRIAQSELSHLRDR